MFRINDPTVTELLFRQVHTAFLEDLAVLQSQHTNIDAFVEDPSQQLDLNQDAGTIQARQVVQQLMAIERTL
jgi:hypothetical protein